MGEKIIEVPAGKNVGQAMKEILQAEAQQKQQDAFKAQQRMVMGTKAANIIQAAMQELAFDPDHAVEIAIGYAAALSLGADVTFDKFVEGAKKIWDNQEKAKDRLVKQQSAQLLAMARAAMAHKQPIAPPIIQQLQVMKVEIPEDIQKWIEEGTNGAASPTEVPVDEKKAAAEKPN
jgi:hypothetical protein